MASGLHQTLKSLCFNTEWSYAVFWKLKHGSGNDMVLTLDDAYYNRYGEGNPSDNSCFPEILDSLCNGSYPHDLLGLALAKMSYHEYPLGEGIVGQVALTGKHQWIIAHDCGTNSSSSVDYCHGWLSEFSAGIRTIVVVPDLPHGVVQLGSLNEVVEDMKLVTHIRNLFLSLKGPSVVSSMENSSCLLDSPKRMFTPDVTPDSLCSPEIAANVEGANVWFPPFPYFPEQNGSSFAPPLPSIYQTKAVEVVNKHRGPAISMSGSDGSTILRNPKSNVIKLVHQNQVRKELLIVNNYEGEIGGSKEMSVDSELNITSHSHSCMMDSFNVYNQKLPMEKLVNLPPGLGDGVDLPANGVLHVNDSSIMKLEEDLENNRVFQAGLGQLDTSETFFEFSSGCELYEALGPAFSKKSINLDREAEKSGNGTILEIPPEMSNTKLAFDSGLEHLLEAVVANFCFSGSDVKNEKSFSKSVQSLLTTENTPKPSGHVKHAVNSTGYSADPPSRIKEGPLHYLSSSQLSDVMPSKGLSSPCLSTISEQLERSSGQAKNKRRARPGENSRPRPRDRQLIQDRIKELRELVPSGSKCSIDSLLERTIKHMLFLQGITKHADKLSKCSDTRLRSKEMAIQGSSTHEHGSSWAVEVGSHPKVCSIIVENINKNGQMLVEMLCDYCTQFLQIAEAITSLDLTILKGATEARGEKTWICFIVEGENNRSIHRMDILWSLVQILQPSTTA